MRLAAAAYQGRDGGDADDGTAGRGLREGHLARGGLDYVEGAVEVGTHRFGVEIVGQVEEFGKGADSGVGDADVQTVYAERLEGEGDEGGAGGWVGYVAGEVGEFACFS